MSGCGPKTPSGFTDVTSESLKGSLARRLVPKVDKLRDLYTRAGMRPYRVLVIKTRSAAGRRGYGPEEVSFKRILDPTPLVIDMSSLTEIVQPVGLDEVGTIRVEEISGRFTEDQLRGFDEQGNPPGADENVFWEIEFPRPGGGDSARRRFVVRSAPMYYADKFEWQVSLEKSHEDRDRAGGLR